MDAFRLRMSLIMFTALVLETMAVELAISMGSAATQRIYGAILVADGLAAGAVIIYLWFRRDQSRQTRGILIVQAVFLLIVSIAIAQGMHQALR
ncbi:MAG: hypothetical protein ACRDID_22755 [Ktedonobacterales bacterium]